ncbi:lysine-2,3-aminomutase-like protein [Lichenibacterium dinghuense]|uniref:lysine-2,3-aminomutase-like protein n=1 Tax=Lichenibacterium dinghuense TaxID=2895977 RepID=UPI001EFFBC24|nr:lysine-2,3-aminomutase-like protein [Lichenibacterium sp. 6Y81]
MSATLRSPADLAAAGLIRPAEVAALGAVAERYAVAVPPAIAALIDPADPADPIARQFVPSAAELDHRPEERADPIGDAAHSPVPGIVHRYPDRVLLTLLHVCPVYCRFCFRRERVGPGADAVLPAAEAEAALDYVAAHPAVWEVILTGGDPLILSPRRIAAVMARLAAIDHVRIVRFHTRVPVVAPELVTPDLVEALQASGKSTYVGVHCNHPRELTDAARAACARLQAAGVQLVSQTVLLRGVNDDAGTLAALMRRFVELGIRPYYLHHGDLAPGTSHLRVPMEEGRALMRALRGRVSGLCQPTYVLDIPGGHGKVPVGPGYAGDGVVTDPWGVSHGYDG